MTKTKMFKRARNLARSTKRRLSWEELCQHIPGLEDASVAVQSEVRYLYYGEDD